MSEQSTSPLPWKVVATGGKRKTSAIVAANGKVVAGSLICEQTPEDMANHLHIVDLLNQADEIGMGYSDLVESIKKCPLSFLPALFIVIVKECLRRSVFKVPEKVMKDTISRVALEETGNKRKSAS